MRAASRIRLVVALLAVALVPGQEVSASPADLSRLVVVGDSLAAGYQNGSLLARQQVHGFASLLAAQAGVPLPLPLIAEPGIPSVLMLVDPGPPPVIIQAPRTSPGRIDPTVQAMNLAVPGQRVRDALLRQPDFPIDSLTDLILGLPGLLAGISRSQVEWAETLSPTTILVWLGNNDTLVAALAADPAAMTPTAEFEAAYAQAMDRLAATGATLVVANLPDVTVVPFLTSAEEVADATGLPLSTIGPILGIGPGDFVTPDAFPLIAAILHGAVPGPLPANVVLDSGEVTTIRAETDELNAFIAAEALAKGAAFVDIHALTASFDARGLVVGGQRLTTAFLGGLFSLDGIHPTNTGHAVIANEFIRALNTRFGTDIPPVSVRQIEMSDPLVLPGVGHPPGGARALSAEMLRSLRAVLGGLPR